jgi:hypothetical protein
MSAESHNPTAFVAVLERMEAIEATAARHSTRDGEEHERNERGGQQSQVTNGTAHLGPVIVG